MLKMSFVLLYTQALIMPVYACSLPGSIYHNITEYNVKYANNYTKGLK